MKGRSRKMESSQSPSASESAGDQSELHEAFSQIKKIIFKIKQNKTRHSIIVLVLGSRQIKHLRSSLPIG